MRIARRRDRAEHTRKRKIVSHVFSQKNVLGFEKHIQTALKELVRQWDGMCSKAATEQGAQFDVLNWLNYFAFDVISMLSFGQSFGMLSAGQDIAPVRREGSNKTEYLPAVQILNDRGEYSATMGVMQPWMRYAAARRNSIDTD